MLPQTNATESRQFAVNNKARMQAMQTPGKYLFGTELVSIKLQAPTIDGYTKKQAIVSPNVSTKEYNSLPYLQLTNNALLAFDVTLIAPIVYTSHAHELMALQNGRAMAFSQEFTVYANLTTIESTETEFLGQAINLEKLHNLIQLFWKESQKESTSEKWRVKSGRYEVSNGKDEKNRVIWKAFQLPKASPESPDTEGNLAPIQDNDIIPADYVVSISKAWGMAIKEDKAREKIAS